MSGWKLCPDEEGTVLAASRAELEMHRNHRTTVIFCGELHGGRIARKMQGDTNGANQAGPT